MGAGQHARAEQEHGVVEQRARSFLNGVELAGDVGHLLEKELVHLQPVRCIGMGEQVVNHVIDAEIREAQRAMVVVELERRDPRGVGLEPEHEDVGHQPHVLADVLRDAVGGAGDVRFVEGRPPALQLSALSGVRNPLFHVANGVEILVELALIAAC